MPDTLTMPEGMNVEHMDYLDHLRESGVTNMFGAGAYLQEVFGMSKPVARDYLSYWMANFTGD